ncbi:adenylate/guanylate cyclase domain-containing protein [Magnetospira sp. QH-2]|uniref:adenylate/guanylate cyclase domain-containing protein n=1 Tax=Magnetospira sp. (strain QH-2) TaxID=1288970 RepID=UPI0003E81542|nr:adenylate/guanylate cyclase domain-containing protein [Magnetospira sp. QH-2]CCQ72915.1 Putative Adenylate cyclase protein [Magnetospira sp. QH-2]
MQDRISQAVDWVMARGLEGMDPMLMVEGLCERLVVAGLPIRRAVFGASTLHPLLEGVTSVWTHGGGVERQEHLHGSMQEGPFLDSPVRYMMAAGSDRLRRRLDGTDKEPDLKFFDQMAADGYQDFIAFMTPFGPREEALAKRDGIYVSWMTDVPEGFAEDHLATLERIQGRLALVAKLANRELRAANVVEAYLGPLVARKVLDGTIQRGDGEDINAVIWFSDLRGSTPMAESLSGPAFLEILNHYFECTAGALRDHGGEILRFIGDAVMGVFPLSGENDTVLAHKALDAACEAERRLDALNEARASEGLEPLGIGIGLHMGPVLFGNIGIPERLEFSVIGPAANEAARLESLTKTVGRRVVVSDRLAKMVPDRLVSLGHYRLRGVTRDVEAFGLRDGQ